jgi:hypothetical protein
VIRTRHRREAAVAPEALWAAARSVRLDDTRTLGRLIGWRIPGTPPHGRCAWTKRARSGG